MERIEDLTILEGWWKYVVLDDVEDVALLLGSVRAPRLASRINVSASVGTPFDETIADHFRYKSADPVLRGTISASFEKDTD